DKVEAVVCNKRTIESMIKAGGFDGLGHTRKGLFERYGPMVDDAVRVKRREAEGQFDLFGGPGHLGGEGPGGAPAPGADVRFSGAEWHRAYLLAQEREMLGLYVSDHPLSGIGHVLAEKAGTEISRLTGGEHPDGAVVTVGGVVSGVRRRTTRQGSAWAIATVEDLSGSVECVFLPAVHRLVSARLTEDALVLVRGRLDRREGVPRLVVTELTVPDLTVPAPAVADPVAADPVAADPAAAGPGAPVTITLPSPEVTPPLVARLGDVLGRHRGSSEVRVRLEGEWSTTVLRLDRYRVSADPSLFGDLEALLGPSRVRAG
ncbi:OB-fold nucleic acid binding domain-containing protein, partial [Streptomyces thermolineatus]